MVFGKCGYFEEREIIDIFELLDYNARLVGGCVRDYLCTMFLVDDVDIATPYTPEVVIQKLSPTFKILTIGIKHGTLTIIGKRKYEITTLRSDTETDGRHAKVSFNADYEQDASRRDFTINALYMDMDNNIYDYFTGKFDLERYCVRFINDPRQRIHEDYLRIMRFFRFVSRFGNYDMNSYNACLELMENLSKISKERVTDELHKMLKGECFFQLFDFFIPVLEYLQFKNIKHEIRYEKLSHLGLLGLFYTSKSPILLTNKEKKYINLINTLKIKNELDALYYADMYGLSFANDLMIINNVDYSIKTFGEFPVNGQDLLNINIPDKEIGGILKKLKYIWLERKGLIHKEGLLKCL